MTKLVTLAALCVLLWACTDQVVKAQPMCDALDSAALQYFNLEIVYAPSEFKTWVPGTNCCTWQGIVCDVNGHVVGLTLSNPVADMPLPTGPLYYIRTCILGLKYLQRLSIRNVPLNGAIPSSWGNLRTLQVFDLKRCNLVGPLPAELCYLKEISVFTLPDNLLNGTLPSCFTTPSLTFPHLRVFDISGNNIS